MNFNKIYLLTTIGLLGCEKILDINLNEDNPKIVVEANLIAGNRPFQVRISRTADYFDSSEPEYISDASVTLSDETGIETDIDPMGNGIYEAQVDAKSGLNYQLSVLIDGTVYTADSYLPNKVELSELIPEYERATPAFDEGYSLFILFSDPMETENYYRIIHSINSKLQLEGDDMQVIGDDLFDGGAARMRLFQQVFESDDTVSVELIHFDQASYSYFNSLADIIGNGRGPNGGNAAPGNPNSNWSGDILGYFSAYSSDTLSTIIPD